MIQIARSTVADAFLAPVVGSYLDRVGAGVPDVRVMTSAGGLVRSGKGTGVGFGTGRDSGVLGDTVGTAVDPVSDTVVNLPAQPLGGFEPFSLGLVYQNIGDVLLAAQLSALQDKGKLNILSSPSITTLDNQTAFIESG